VTLRKVPGALALGLLASLAAHAALYRGAHAMGAEYHALLLETAALGILALAAAFVHAAWRGAKAFSDGSILAYRLSRHLPSAPAVFAAAIGWFALAERLEPHHAGVATAVTAIVLAAAAWLIVAMARGLLAALARVAISIAASAFVPRAVPARRVVLRAPRPKTPHCSRRRFARPPPPIVWLSRA